MKAFLYDGKGLGSGHSTVTKHYKSVPNLFKYAVKPFMHTHGDFCRVELYYNWDNRFGPPDKTIIYTKEGGQILREDLPKEK